MKTLFISAFLALTMLASTAEAQPMYQNGNELHKDLYDSSTSSNMFALGYIVGVTDALLGTTLCISPNVSQGQLMDVVKKFMNDNPQVRNLPAAVIVFAALDQYWPCEKQKRKKS